MASAAELIHEQPISSEKLYTGNANTKNWSPCGVVSSVDFQRVEAMSSFARGGLHNAGGIDAQHCASSRLADISQQQGVHHPKVTV